jgi:tRNA threonylcarbamoyladenosine biosynthesis protein TsaB
MDLYDNMMLPKRNLLKDENEMLQLFLDTSTDSILLGLAFQDEVLDSLVLSQGRASSKFLFPALLELLQKNKYTPKDLELIGCGIGPGSYTGMRVGAALAQSMAYALRVPLVGISSLECYLPSHPGSFAVILDAKYGGIYFQKGIFNGKKALFDPAPEVAALAEVHNRLGTIPMIVTPHMAALKERIGNLLPLAEWDEVKPSPQIFAQRVYDCYSKGDFSSRAELKLHYLRKTQAEYENQRDLA